MDRPRRNNLASEGPSARRSDQPRASSSRPSNSMHSMRDHRSTSSLVFAEAPRRSSFPTNPALLRRRFPDRPISSRSDQGGLTARYAASETGARATAAAEEESKRRQKLLDEKHQSLNLISIAHWAHLALTKADPIPEYPKMTPSVDEQELWDSCADWTLSFWPPRKRNKIKKFFGMLKDKAPKPHS